MDHGYDDIKMWDAVTRSWHWALAASVIAGWCLGEFRSFSTIDWHFYLGYTTGALVVFRYLWGFIGPEPIRHATLVGSLPRLDTYLRTALCHEPSGTRGYNPLGALSIIAMIVALTFQVTTGLFSEDDGLFSAGPLAAEVTGATVRRMTNLHNIGAKVVLGLTGLHVAAVLFYLVWKRENLITPMLTGWKRVKK